MDEIYPVDGVVDEFANAKYSSPPRSTWSLGDPRWLPHPVRGIGWLACQLEGLDAPRIGADAAGWGCWRRWSIYGVGRPGRLGADSSDGPDASAGRRRGHRSLVIYTTIAAVRSGASQSWRVPRLWPTANLATARLAVANIVGRDVERLDASGVARAAVESVAESTVDGVTAPLFYAFLAGPVGAMVYRAVNTLGFDVWPPGRPLSGFRLGCGATRRRGELCAGSPVPRPCCAWPRNGAGADGRGRRCGF
jgi:hypothetical protein